MAHLKFHSMSDAVNQGSVEFSIQEGIATIEFFHPLSNSLPGKILGKLAQTITELGANEEARVYSGAVQ